MDSNHRSQRPERCVLNQTRLQPVIIWYPRQDSNPQCIIRSDTCYPLHYEGMELRAGLEPAQIGFAIQRLNQFGYRSMVPPGRVELPSSD